MTASASQKHRNDRAVDHAAEVGTYMASRVRFRDAQIRQSFVRQTDQHGPDPWLARELRGGRGGEVRLKLHISLLWFAVAPPHGATLPFRAWAELLGLDDPEARGARRVRAAAHWLAERNLVTLAEQSGHPSTLTLLQEDGSGEPYTVPGARISKAVEDGEVFRLEDVYLKVPVGVWQNGWLAVLSGSAVAMLLTVLSSSRPDRGEIWFSQEFAASAFRLSVDTRSKGLAELVDHGVLTARRRAVGRGETEFRRFRTTYTPTLERFDSKPGEPR